MGRVAGRGSNAALGEHDAGWAGRPAQAIDAKDVTPKVPLEALSPMSYRQLES